MLQYSYKSPLKIGICGDDRLTMFVAIGIDEGTKIRIELALIPVLLDILEKTIKLEVISAYVY